MSKDIKYFDAIICGAHDRDLWVKFQENKITAEEYIGIKKDCVLGTYEEIDLRGYDPYELDMEVALEIAHETSDLELAHDMLCKADEIGLIDNFDYAYNTMMDEIMEDAE